jgi:hypothetical protein
MSIKALVVNAYDKPVSNATVTFVWKTGGTSTVKADSNGFADSGRQDTLVSISAYGKTRLDLGREGRYLKEAVFKIKV